MNPPSNPWRLSVAPMMDWTDRHCRFFLRLISRHARLYTEMVTAAALTHGDLARHLDDSAEERPLALQLGGSDPGALAHGARLGERWGYDEINLNCGCPSERVQTGSFGACLMAEPQLVADAVKAMRDAVSLPVTVKHRIGLDHEQGYGFVRDFVGTVAAAGCEVFIVHARNAVLKGLSPKENREIPPLRREVVHWLKRDFPALTIVTNGGLNDWAAIEREWQAVDGAMLGRAAYHDPWLLCEADAHLTGARVPPVTRSGVLHALVRYAEVQAKRGVPLRAIARHALGLYHGVPGGRRYRRLLSEPLQLRDASPRLLLDAMAMVEGESALAAPA